MPLIVPSRIVLRRATLLGAGLALALAGCAPVRDEPAPVPPDTAVVIPAPDTIARDTVAIAAFEPRYQRFAVRRPKRLRALLDSIGPASTFEVLKLNRVDLEHIRDRDSLVVPEAFGDSLDFAPYPRAIAALGDSAKMLLISLRVQAFAAYDSGQLRRWGPTSTGRRDMPTPTGLYHTNWKDKSRISTFSDEWKLEWYVNLDNFQGVSLHEYELPGYPASHSCVRLLEADAIWMYSWAEQWRLAADRRVITREGTPAVVFGEWTWGARAPWKRLPEGSLATTIAAAEIDDALRILRDRVKPVYPPRQARMVSVSGDSVGRKAAPVDSTGGR